MNRKLFLVLALALLVRMITFCGYVGQPDEITNVELVREVLEGPWPTYEDRIVEMVFPTRIGYVGVNSLLVGFFGASDFSFTIYSLLSSLLTVVLVYLLGKRWLGDKGAFLSALLFAFFPLDVIFSTKISSDPALNFLCTLSVFLFFSADDRTPRGRRILLCFLAGCVVGFAYLHKVTAGYFCILFFVIGVADMVRKRRFMLRYLFLAVGFLALFAVEMGFQTEVNGDPFYRWNVFLTQSQSAEMRQGLHAEERFNGWKDDAKRLFWTFPTRSLVSMRLGFYFWFIFPAVLYCLLFRRKELWAPLLWWLLIALLLNLSTFGGGRLPFYARQVYSIAVPGMILLAAALLRLREWNGLDSGNMPKAFGGLLAVIAVLSSAGFAGCLIFRKSLVPLFARFYSSRHTIVPEEVVEWVLGLFFQYVVVAAFVSACFFIVLCLVAWRRERAGVRNWTGGVLVAAIVGFLAISSSSLAYMANRGVPKIEKDAYGVLRDLPPKTVYADWFTKKMLDFYSDFREDFQVVDFRDVSLPELRDGYLVYNAFRKNLEQQLRATGSQYDRDHQYLYPYDSVDQAIGEDWVVLGDVSNGLIVLYRIP